MDAISTAISPPNGDPTWEDEIYRRGRHLNRYPYDSVVSFVYRHAPRDIPRGDVRILEVGCGAGNNLAFAAREGFSVAGIDASPSAIAFARQRFQDEHLTGDLRVGDFSSLSFGDGAFDLAIDRAAITCVGRSAARRAVAEVCRVLRPGGYFLFNPYSAGHSSARFGRRGDDGLVHEISGGTLQGVGHICFYSRDDVEGLFSNGWSLASIEHVRIDQVLDAAAGSHCEWRVVARRSET
jgi:SAM-dependent methyltransferase